jgi:hypothetical protein
MKRLWKFIREEWNFYEYGCYMEGNRAWKVVFLYHLTKDWLKGLVCHWKGHDWIDESYGGPDSGCMAGTCKRCGYSFHTQLY